MGDRCVPDVRGGGLQCGGDRAAVGARRGDIGGVACGGVRGGGARVRRWSRAGWKKPNAMVPASDAMRSKKSPRCAEDGPHARVDRFEDRRRRARVSPDTSGRVPVVFRAALRAMTWKDASNRAHFIPLHAAATARRECARRSDFSRWSIPLDATVEKYDGALRLATQPARAACARVATPASVESDRRSIVACAAIPGVTTNASR